VSADAGNGMCGGIVAGDASLCTIGPGHPVSVLLTTKPSILCSIGTEGSTVSVLREFSVFPQMGAV
jgi:hypothetical protein